MIGARVCMIAGVAGIAATMPANASVQDCPEWLRWACSNSASSNPVRDASREAQRTRTPAASTSQMHPTPKHMRAAPDGVTPQQTNRWVKTHAVRAARNTGSSGGVSNSQEREALFQEFSAWQKARRLDADANSGLSGDQRSAAMNNQEKEALFQQFSAWQKTRRLNADANR